MPNKKLNIAFIHGRPKGHPTHAMYAKSIGSTFFHEDRILRWQDLNESKIKRYLSWFLNALFFTKRRFWDVYFTECVRIPQLIQKKLFLIGKKQKLIAIMSDESLYFTYIKRFPRLTQQLMLAFWKNCDAIICIGEFQFNLACKLLPKNHHSKLYTIFNGVPESRLNALQNIKPNLKSNNILFIGNASADWRVNYKGLDLMLEAFANCYKSNSKLTFTIVGDIPKELSENLLFDLEPNIRPRVNFTGPKDNIEDYLKNSSLYLHCARGEAWGVSIIEALCAGVPAIISDQTGAKQVIKNLNPDFILPLDVNTISNSILKYFSLSSEEKLNISQKAKQVVQDFTEVKAKEHFVNTFDSIVKDLRIHS